MPETILCFINGALHLTSLNSLKLKTKITTIFIIDPYNKRKFNIDEIATIEEDVLGLNEYIIHELSQPFRKEIFKDRMVINVRRIGRYFAIDWILNVDKDKSFYLRASDILIEYVSFDEPVIGLPIHQTTASYKNHCLLNINHPFVKWLLRFKDACINHKYCLNCTMYENILFYLSKPIQYSGYKLPELLNYLNEFKDLPEEIAPNQVITEVNTNCFMAAYRNGVY